MVARYNKDGSLDYQSMRLGHSYYPGDPTAGNYVYTSGSHRLDHVTDSLVSGMAEQDTVNYVYDDNGNMICDRAKGMVLTYDWRDMVSKYSFYDISDIGADGKPEQGADAKHEIEMVYDADGLRVAKKDFIADTGGISYLKFKRDDGAEYRLSDNGDFYYMPGLIENSTNTPDSTSLKFSTTTHKMWMTETALNIKGELLKHAIIPGLGLKFSKGTQELMELSSDGDLWIRGRGPTTTTYYVLDASGSEITTYDEFGTKQSMNLYAGGLVGRETPDGKQYFYLQDNLGSTRVVVSENAAGNALEVVEAYDFYPYGKQIPLVQTATERTRQTFTGKELDSESGTYYFGARYFDPNIAIWTARDPDGQFWSPYAYTGNNWNPVVGVDKAGNRIVWGDLDVMVDVPKLKKQLGREELAMYMKMSESPVEYEFRAMKSPEIDVMGNSAVYGYVDWGKKSAVIHYILGNVTSFKHEFLGHGYQMERQFEQFRGLWGDDVGLVKAGEYLNLQYSGNADARVEYEREAYAIAGQVFTKEIEAAYRQGSDYRIQMATPYAISYGATYSNMSRTDIRAVSDKRLQELQLQYWASEDPAEKQRLQDEMLGIQMARQ